MFDFSFSFKAGIVFLSFLPIPFTLFNPFSPFPPQSQTFLKHFKLGEKLGEGEKIIYL